jgi:putative flippase GtrA
MSRFEQFIRFAIVGGVATGIQYAILIALVQGALAGPVAASSVGFAVSAIINYALNRSITFRSSQAHAEALPKFAIVAVLGLAVNASLIWLFHIPVGLHYLLAQVLATGGTLLWNFTLNRIWTFSPRTSQHYCHKETP